MLSEFAFTPQIFDEPEPSDAALWWEHLRELGNHMFPLTASCPVLVSNLYDGGWESEARRSIGQISNQSVRLRCQSLLQKIADVLVKRPVCGDWPTNEGEWRTEALNCDRSESIQRILVSSSAYKSGGCPQIRSLAEVEDAGFWHGVVTESSPSMIIEEQVSLLRKICLHSHFLCLVTPYVFGGLDDDSDFAISLIQSAQARPDGYAGCDIEIHTMGPRCDRGSPDHDERCQRHLSSIGKKLVPVLKPSTTVKVFLWPKLLDRVLVGGTFAYVDGQARRKPRWGVSMNHIAQRREASEATLFTEWKLLGRDSLRRWFDLRCVENVSGFTTCQAFTAERAR